jgi:hypothetical protein
MSSYCGVKEIRVIARIEPAIYIRDVIDLLCEEDGTSGGACGGAQCRIVAEFQQRDAAVIAVPLPLFRHVAA